MVMRMEPVHTITYKGRQILVLDYSDRKPDEMIELIKQAQRLLQANDWRDVLLLSILNKKNYITPAVVRQIEVSLRTEEHRIKRNVVVGLSQIQIWIIKGVNLWYKQGLVHKNTVDEALEYLVSGEGE
jgi:hypothetical protein